MTQQRQLSDPLPKDALQLIQTPLTLFAATGSQAKGGVVGVGVVASRRTQ